MVSEIRLYVEGGGDGNDTKAWLHEGLHTFLHKLVDLARSKRIKWQIIACGPRIKAFRAFEMALATHPEVCNILLVDAEGPVHTLPWQHLQNRDAWRVSGIDDQHCHVMVQTMEAWLGSLRIERLSPASMAQGLEKVCCQNTRTSSRLTKVRWHPP